MSTKTTSQVDYKPFLVRSQMQIGNNQESYFNNPLFLNSTSYGSQYANWGAKPFERVRAVDKKMLDFKF